MRVVYDAVGSWSTPPSFFAALEASGVEVVPYNPITGEIFRNWGFRRDHRKFLVVDGNIGFVGGMNLTEESMGGSEAYSLYDLGVLFRGNEAAALDELFDYTWAHSRLPLRLLKRRAPSSSDVEVVSNRFPRRLGIYRNLLRAMISAERTIDILNPYFLPTRRILRVLHSAILRGVRVRVLVPSWSDVRFVDLAMEGGCKHYMKLGIELYQWPGFIHAKCLTVDQVWSAVGSFNFDYLSILSNLEVMAFVREPAFNRTLAEEVEAQFEISRKLTVTELQAKPLWRRGLANFLYTLRRWF